MVAWTKTVWSRKPTGRGLKFKNHVFASGNWFLFNKIFTWLPMRYWSINLKLKRSLVGIKFSQFKQFSQTHVNNSKILGIVKPENPNPASQFWTDSKNELFKSRIFDSIKFLLSPFSCDYLNLVEEYSPGFISKCIVSLFGKGLLFSEKL